MLLQHILVPVDLSARSEAALRYALDLSRSTGAKIDLLHVLPPESLAGVAMDLWLDRPVGGVHQPALSSAHAALAALLAKVGATSEHVHSRIEVGDPAATIVRVATEDTHDLIILGTRGRIGLADLLLGSVAKKLITCAPCPVVTLRPKPAASA
jgi:nucleotide-binding universal stress UspA family protein